MIKFRNKICLMALLTSCVTEAMAQNDSIPFEESTAAISVIKSKDIEARSSKDIGNSIVGAGLGLYSKQAAGNYASANPTFYVRGLQSLSGSTPLILVDGIEREIKNISSEEVEEVQILKDAAAVALYGRKGVNGVILIKTKRGRYNSREIKFTYDHTFSFMRRKPEFVDAYTYASAVNEARGYEDLAPMYSSEAMAAFRDGTYPYSYPNVDWVDETFRDNASNNKFNIEFSGGSDKFRYYVLAGLITDKGFIKNANENDGYSTQNKYVRGNLRVNLDAKITPTTDMRVNLQGVLMESSRPGDSANLWDMVYSVPSAAFPVKTEDGLWGGNSTWSGLKNPVAQAQGAAYSKNHQRSLFADLTLTQDLKSITEGLEATARIAYDNSSNVYENHSLESYLYGMAVPGVWMNGQPTITNFTGGTPSEMGDGAETNDYAHLFNFNIGLNYRRTFGRHSLYSQLRWNYENQETYGTNKTVFRQDASLYARYGYDKRYFVDMALVASGSSRLAPGSKWAFSPTLSAAWVVSREKFMKNVKWIDLLKLRASAGIINADFLPEDTWTYFIQSYNTGAGAYMFTSNYTTGGIGSGTTLGRIATTSCGYEKAYKYNVGIDARLFGGLDVTLDAYMQHRTDIWVSSEGKYTSIVGFEKPFENAGVVDSYGFEIGLDYNRTFGKVDFNVGGNFSYNKNEIKEQLEEPRLYSNLVETGHPVGQIFGLQAIGFFKDQADIDASLTQTFSTVRPGDIKYKDVNGDKKIDANDKVAIGYNTTCPEITYNFHVGAEWKGLGVYAVFQGVGNYSAILNTKSMFWPLIDNNTISQYAYDNRWTLENPNAKFPRLSSQSNANNYQTNSLWVADRSYLKLRNLEVYYKLPKSLMEKIGFINAAKVYVKGTDLFCIDGIDVVDPENYGATNPMTTSIVAGVSLTF